MSLEFPVYLHFGTHRILLHMVTELASFFIAFRVYVYLKKKQGDTISGMNRLYILLGATIGALLGSRLLGGLEDPAALAASASPLQYFYMNKTVVGGFLGGLTGVEITKKIIGEKQRSGDLYTYPILLGLIIGRIGCFSMGVQEETYGLPTRLFTGMDLGDGLLRHPVALYEIVFLLLLALFLRRTGRAVQLDSGARFKIFMIGYLLFRFLLDFIKPHYTWPVGLSSIQIACLLGLLYYFRYIIQPKKLLIRHAGPSIHLL
ncbi:prolipoprotein diacylglyceryl transferase family protein [Niabella beijingensis]|uniref:prolipoprotein diacylglyceryl transferase family protein n=1 Tax=Niabella beijingensis TaxID=2872700 RepID=UPI001CBD4594|nr:prolipoprotein diacylglyceryl transferase family protein [Niabella beijingensis]MBZ4190161.1 prolipoprotein diacylglyceryl transferase [Niabella beijingensis]